nr:unnamed protein product [Callosobruchus analis]
MKLILLTAVFVASLIPEGYPQRDYQKEMFRFYNACYRPKPFEDFLALWQYILSAPGAYDPKDMGIYSTRAVNAVRVYPQLGKFMTDDQLLKYLPCMKDFDKKLNEEVKSEIQPYIDRQLYCMRHSMDRFVLEGKMGTVDDFIDCYVNTEICDPQPTQVHGTFEMKLILLTASLLASLIPEGCPQRDYQKDMYRFYNACYRRKPFEEFLALWQYVLSAPGAYDPKDIGVYSTRAKNAVKAYPQLGKFMTDDVLKKYLPCMKKFDEKLNQEVKNEIQPYVERQLYCMRHSMDRFIIEGQMGTVDSFIDCYVNTCIHTCDPNPIQHEIVAYYEGCFKHKPFHIFAALYDYTHPYVIEELKNKGNESRYERALLSNAFSDDEMKKYLECQDIIYKRLNQEQAVVEQQHRDAQLFCLRQYVDQFLLKHELATDRDYKDCFHNALNKCKPDPRIIAISPVCIDMLLPITGLGAIMHLIEAIKGDIPAITPAATSEIIFYALLILIPTLLLVSWSFFRFLSTLTADPEGRTDLLLASGLSTQDRVCKVQPPTL